MSNDPRRQLRAFQKKSGLSIVELAHKLGISRQHLHRLLGEDSARFPSRELEARIFDVARVQPAAWAALYRRQSRHGRAGA
jgi:transcriptional regulator with XRE-family HTH domain